MAEVRDLPEHVVAAAVRSPVMRAVGRQVSSTVWLAAQLRVGNGVWAGVRGVRGAILRHVGVLGGAGRGL